MSQTRLQAQRVDINYDSLLFNGKEFMKSDRVFVNFTGAVGPSTITRECVVSRTGNIGCINILSAAYNGQQAAGLITCMEGSIPPLYRPVYDDAKINGVMIINGSAVGATGTQATQLGCMQINKDGSLVFALTVDNAGNMVAFGGAGESGSGNGVSAGCYTYPIGLR